MSGSDEVRMTNDELEGALAGLTPTALEVDRDALMYRAGYEAARGSAASRRSIRLWQSSTALMTAASLALAVTLWRQPAPEPLPQYVGAPPTAASEESIAKVGGAPEETVTVTQAAELSPIDPLLLADPNKNYLALRAVVLRRGVDAWTTGRTHTPVGAPSSAPSRPSTVRGMMEEFLPPPPETKRSTNDNPNEASTNREEPVV